MTNLELANKLIDIAKNVKTLYVMGGIGYPLNAKGKQRAYKNSWNTDPDRVKFIEAASDDTFAFDCVCLIKSVLWGFVADPSKTYGGAVYKANGVPDIGADTMITKCSDISTDFSKIEIGEAVWMKGHIGVYVGNGLAVECTPIWGNDVQLTACNCSKSGYNRRNWTKHGKLPYITYENQAVAEPTPDKNTPTLKEMSAADAEKAFYKYLTETLGLNCAAACGVLANIAAESAFRSTNLQNTYEKKLGYTDTEYTLAVDNGSYDNFVKDAAGYGFAQWTYWSRKQKLLEFAKSKGKSIGDAEMQMQFFGQEIKGYSGVWKTLQSVPNTAEGAYEAGHKVCYDYEAPAAKQTSAVTRGNSAKTYFAKYGGSAASSGNAGSTEKPVESVDYAIGDKVYVNGKIYAYGNGKGNSLTKNNATMYVCDIVDKKTYPHYIGVSAIKGGTRQGWAKPDILSKSSSVAPAKPTTTTKPTTTAKPAETAPATGYVNYTVVGGDNLTKIAAKFKTTIAKIVAANNIKDANKIWAGQVLKIPSASASASSNATPTVNKTFAKGDAVIVNGTITGYGNGGGGSIVKKGVRMFVCDIVDSSTYKNYIGVSAYKGGARQGWANPSILKKA